MVDSLNVVIDQDQRSRQRPVWTTDAAGKVFGIDSQFIHVAGIKIPTAALALLPITLPQGNYDEQRRARQLGEMRGGLMQAGRRTEALDRESTRLDSRHSQKSYAVFFFEKKK